MTTDELTQFRDQVRRWARQHADPDLRDRLRTAEDEQYRELMRRQAALLREAGYLTPHWPADQGGGFSVAQQAILQRELVRARFVPPALLSIALGHAAATVMLYGTPEQHKHLEAIRNGQVWCQGFSEPEAGSDLAGLRTAAVREGDYYVVNGRKIWSTYAHLADRCLLLTRTDPKARKHRGLTMFALDLSSPGVELRKIRQATGVWEFCEITLTDVRIPVSDRLGEENEGWRVANTTLATERASQIIEQHAGLEDALEMLRLECARVQTGPGRVAAQDAAVRQELGARIAEVEVLGALAATVIGGIDRHGEVGPEGSVLKLFYSETLQKLTGLATRIRGVAADIDLGNLADTGWISGDWMVDHIKSWTQTIAAGSNEIQRNIIAEKVLGLPREQEVAR
jgi:alkylation response protein AidB-like acyl-CoA dehydrogenase